MGSPEALTIHIDGAARGNPGPAAWAYVIHGDGAAPVEHAECLGHATNNVAEYTALVRALERAAALGAKRLIVRSDSELLVKQMNGQYRVKNEQLIPLYEQAKRLARGFDLVSLGHVRREQNRRADELCNLALDGKAAAKPSRPARAPAQGDAVREEALACLRGAAETWARDGLKALDPAIVWDQLWSVLEDAGVLKRPKG
jgi:ribonuclease HI